MAASSGAAGRGARESEAPIGRPWETGAFGGWERGARRLSGCHSRAGALRPVAALAAGRAILRAAARGRRAQGVVFLIT